MGMAFIIVPLVAMLSIVSFLTATLAAHWFLNVIESTAAGGKEVIWSDEPFVDRFWKVFYVAWHGVIWAGPAMFIGQYAGGGSATAVFLFGSVAFWLMFPMGMLSGMSSGSKWLPLVPGLPARLAQRMPALIGFYAVSLPVFAAFVLLFAFGIVRSQTPLPLAVVTGALSGIFMLLYARVLGRLGLVLSFTEGGSHYEDPAERKKARRTGPTREMRDQPGMMSAAVPRATEEMPESERPTANIRYTATGSITGYDVHEDETEERVAPVAAIVHRFDDEDDTPMRMIEPTAPSITRAATQSRAGEARSEAVSATAAGNVARAEVHVAREDEIALFDKTRRVTEPTSPYGPDLWAFAFHPAALGVLLKLCALMGLVSALLAGLRAARGD